MTATSKIRFIKNKDPDQATMAIYGRLLTELASGKRVLWIISGGSNIPIVVEIMKRLDDKLLSRLAILLCDERYGEFGHADSNMQQLTAAGFEARGTTVIAILGPKQGTLEQITTGYAGIVSFMLEHAETVISQLGIGADGHIAGILPGSSAVRSTKAVASYQSDPYTRITMTFAALKQAAVTYVLAYGDAKLPALTNLRDKKLPVSKQPAQFLKQLPEVYVYNDQIGDEA